MVIFWTGAPALPAFSPPQASVARATTASADAGGERKHR
jgi:hypothetical protein